MARPFQEVTTLSSRAGWGRAARAASRRARVSCHQARVGGVLAQLQGRRAVLEGAARGHGEQRGGAVAVLLPEHLRQLGGRPGVGQALDALGVGVERGGEPALGRAQVAQQEVGGLAGDPLGQRRAGGPPQVDVDAQQLGVVVQHLLEVRHDPGGVHGVAGEAAGELVVHAAAGHRLAGGVGHLQRAAVPGAGVVAQQELQHHRRRELRRAAEPAVAGVEGRGEPGDRLVQDVVADGGGRALLHGGAQLLGDVGAAGEDLVAALGPGLGDGRRAAAGTASSGSRCRRRTARPWA